MICVGMALRFANACGAICTTAVGAGTALRSRGQVLEFLGKFHGSWHADSERKQNKMQLGNV